MLSHGCVDLQWLPAEIAHGPSSLEEGELGGSQAIAGLNRRVKESSSSQVSLPMSAWDGKLVDHEKALILQSLEHHHWNQLATARALGITRDVLRYRMKKYQLARISKA